MGLLMFSETSLKSLQSITGQIGLAVTNSSTQKHLYSMSAVVSEKICSIGTNWVKRSASFHVVYNNINQYHKDWQPSLSSQTSMESGTAATLIMQPGMASDTFDEFKYKECWRHVVSRIRLYSVSGLIFIKMGHFHLVSTHGSKSPSLHLIFPISTSHILYSLSAHTVSEIAETGNCRKLSCA